MAGKLIIVEGLIGAGKSSFCKQLGRQLAPDAEVFLEPDDQQGDRNPYLSDYYDDPPRWAFTMQVHLMQARYRAHLRAQDVVWDDKHAILDRSIYADVEFGHLQHDLQVMPDREFETYSALYHSLLAPNIREPDLLVWLQVSPDVALERIHRRSIGRQGRKCEARISRDYLEALDARLQAMVERMENKGVGVLTVDWNEDAPAVEDRQWAMVEVMKSLNGDV